MDPSLIISLLSGAAGGNAAGALLKNTSMGLLGNSLAGIVGGGLGGKLIGLAGIGGMGSAGGLDAGSIFSSLLSGGVGGGDLMWIVGMVRQMMAK